MMAPRYKSPNVMEYLHMENIEFPLMFGYSFVYIYPLLRLDSRPLKVEMKLFDHDLFGRLHGEGLYYCQSYQQCLRPLRSSTQPMGDSHYSPHIKECCLHSDYA